MRYLSFSEKVRNEAYREIIPTLPDKLRTYMEVMIVLGEATDNEVKTLLNSRSSDRYESGWVSARRDRAIALGYIESTRTSRIDNNSKKNNVVWRVAIPKTYRKQLNPDQLSIF